jgi:hypothetical protein
MNIPLHERWMCTLEFIFPETSSPVCQEIRTIRVKKPSINSSASESCPAFGLEFLDEFQDKRMFGTDSFKRSDANHVGVSWRRFANRIRR